MPPAATDTVPALPRPLDRGVNDAPSPEITTARVLLLFATFLCAACYFTWRTFVFDPGHPLFSALFYAIEIVGFLWGMTFLAVNVRFLRRDPPPAPPGLSVDVFITTYNEPVDLVRRTVVAALRISYPHETWLLDDGDREAMRSLAQEVGCRYLPRAKNVDAKAGNLNNGLARASGEFVAVFDADHIAAPEFLDRTLGYFCDPKLSFVQTPHEFYNYDSFQHMGSRRASEAWSEHSLFYRVVQRGRDRIGAAMLCGSAAVLRRRALDSVGGFATGTVTEDMHTSVLLHQAGWTSAIHPQTLSIGLAPHDARSFDRQRLGWAQGAMQVFRRENLMTCRGLRPGQRLSYLMHVGTYAEGVRYAVIYLAPIATLIFGVAPLRADLGTWALISFPYLAATLLAFEELSRGQGRFFRNEAYNLARCPSTARSVLTLLSEERLPFWVTPKGRIRHSGSAFPWVILTATLAALAVGIWRQTVGDPALLRGPFLVVALWACYNAAAAARVCLLTLRTNAERRALARFPVELPARVRRSRGAGEEVRATVTAVSCGGLSIRAAWPQDTLPSGPCAVALELAERRFDLRAELRAAPLGAATGGTISALTNDDRDDFEYLIHRDRIRALAAFDAVDDRTHLAPLARLLKRIKDRWAAQPSPEKLEVEPT